jgi:hypothetical protein
LAAGFFLAGTVIAGAIFSVPQLGQPEWELAAFGEFATTIVPGMTGLGGLAVLSLIDSRRRLATGVGIGLVVLGVLCAFGALLVVTNLPLVWQAVGGGVPVALKYAAVKSVGLLSVYAVGSWVMAGYVLRSSILAR